MKLSRLVLAGVGAAGMVGAGFVAPAMAATHPSVKPAPAHTVHAASFSSCTDNQTLDDGDYSEASIGVNGSDGYSIQQVSPAQTWDVCYSLNGDGLYYFKSDHSGLYMTDDGTLTPDLNGNATGAGVHEGVVITCTGKNSMSLAFNTGVGGDATIIYSGTTGLYYVDAVGAEGIDVEGRCTA